MKTLVFVAVIFGFSQFDVSTAQTAPPLPDDLHNCQYTVDYAVRCEDRFGNYVICVPVIDPYFRRWDCHG